jgi:hypothetical protein
MRDITLPRWEPRDHRERDALKRWTIERLDQERASRPRSRLALKDDSGVVGIEPPIPNLTTKLFALIAADAGYYEPLFTLYPKLRHPGRGTHRRHARTWALQQAVADVKRIRAIWKIAFGKWTRRDALAREIAAERWQIDLGDLHNALKQKSRKTRS